MGRCPLCLPPQTTFCPLRSCDLGTFPGMYREFCWIFSEVIDSRIWTSESLFVCFPNLQIKMLLFRTRLVETFH